MFKHELFGWCDPFDCLLRILLGGDVEQNRDCFLARDVSMKSAREKIATMSGTEGQKTLNYP